VLYSRRLREICPDPRRALRFLYLLMLVSLEILIKILSGVTSLFHSSFNSEWIDSLCSHLRLKCADCPRSETAIFSMIPSIADMTFSFGQRLAKSAFAAVRAGPRACPRSADRAGPRSPSDRRPLFPRVCHSFAQRPESLLAADPHLHDRTFSIAMTDHSVSRLSGDRHAVPAPRRRDDPSAACCSPAGADRHHGR
jgi:hypothetical protein